MLTQEQLEKLEPLTQHPKYGKLLSDAIEVWKKENATPTKGTWGIIDDWEVQFNSDGTGRYCLIGAGLLDKLVVDHSKIATVSNYFKLDNLDFDLIVWGFDNVRVYDEFQNHDAYQFGLAVSKILFDSDLKEKP